MLLFCPTCGNVLIVEEGQKCLRFACNTCPYVHNVTRKVGGVNFSLSLLSLFTSSHPSSYFNRTRSTPCRSTTGSIRSWKRWMTCWVALQRGKTSTRRQVTSVRGRVKLCCACDPPSQFNLRTRCGDAVLVFCRNVSQVWAPSSLLHADPDPISWWAHDHLLQVLQCPVWTPVERLKPLHPFVLYCFFFFLIYWIHFVFYSPEFLHFILFVYILMWKLHSRFKQPSAGQ